jgi:hypothetical protein
VDSNGDDGGNYNCDCNDVGDYDCNCDDGAGDDYGGRQSLPGEHDRDHWHDQVLLFDFLYRIICLTEAIL